MASVVITGLLIIVVVSGKIEVIGSVTGKAVDITSVKQLTLFGQSHFFLI